ncbi:MAG: MBL fold metallo-hydrolase [Microscillaceae bacterium]|nr:MBL fold metallo-hydrolase [Microscillaceae bacterium]MDW8459912.1 MBL fold metallo-hydrolase [Cytophagales bacterium]
MPHTIKKYQFQNVYYFEFGKALLPFRPAPMTVYCFWLDGLLIDTAQKSMQKYVFEMLEPYPIEQIVLTHYHEDHAGNVKNLAEKYQVPVFAGELTAKKIRDGFKILPYEKILFNSVPPYEHIQPLPSKIQTNRYELLPIHTPGHSPDHYVFLEKKQGWLFSGDFYLGKLRFFRREENIAQHIESLHKILEYDFEVLFCGHYPSLRNGKALMQGKLQYLEDFYGKVAQLYAQGKSLKEILKEIEQKEVYWLKIATFNDVGVDYMIKSVIANEQQKQQIKI